VQRLDGLRGDFLTGNGRDDVLDRLHVQRLGRPPLPLAKVPRRRGEFVGGEAGTQEKKQREKDQPRARPRGGQEELHSLFTVYYSRLAP